jgi:hypothetical protein
MPLLRATSISTMIDRTKKAAVTTGTLLYLASVALAGAATITSFGIASISFLGTPTDAAMQSRLSDNILRHNRGNDAAAPEQTNSPPPDLAMLLPSFPERQASTSEPVEVTEAEPDPHSIKTQSIEGSGSEKPAAAEPGPITDEVDATAITSQPNAVSDVPDEGRDQLSRSVEFQRNQPPQHHQDHLGSDAKAPARKVENRSVPSQLLSPDAAFRSRVQKECGPIIFPKLYRHCVASFGVYPR